MLQLTLRQLLIINSWPPSQEVNSFREGLGKLIRKGDLIKIDDETGKPAQ